MSLPKIDCSFEIPKPFKWNESFKVFYDHLDDEHRGLFDGIFNVNEKRGDAAVLADLLGKVKFHFDSEEKDLEVATSAGKLTKSYLDSHKAGHKKFVEILSTLKTPVSDDAVDYAMRWLVNHIKATDFQYKDKLVK